MENNRDSFIFYRSFFEAIDDLPLENQANIYKAIASYALNGELIALNQWENALFKTIRPQLDANRKRYENGCKGGAPKGNQNARKQPKTTENNQKQPNDNVNENDNENDNVNDCSYPPFVFPPRGRFVRSFGRTQQARKDNQSIKRFSQQIPEH